MLIILIVSQCAIIFVLISWHCHACGSISLYLDRGGIGELIKLFSVTPFPLQGTKVTTTHQILGVTKVGRTYRLWILDVYTDSLCKACGISLGKWQIWPASRLDEKALSSIKLLEFILWESINSHLNIQLNSINKTLSDQRLVWLSRKQSGISILTVKELVSLQLKTLATVLPECFILIESG